MASSGAGKAPCSTFGLGGLRLSRCGRSGWCCPPRWWRRFETYVSSTPLASGSCRARLAEDAVSAVLAAGEDDLEELRGYVAAEANHEKDRRRQKRLDQAFQAHNDVVDRP